jgi:hypothetical protein
MNFIELKDLEINKEYNVVFLSKKKDDIYYIPCIVNVTKHYTIKFVKPAYIMNSPLKNNVEYSYEAFWHEFRGYDLFGNKFLTLAVFDNSIECTNWCNVNNKLNHE